MPENNIEIFSEILESSKMGSFLNWGNQQIANIQQADPSWTWSQIKQNPWLAMAVYDDIEDKDGRVGSCLETRKNAVMSKNWRIIPASESRQDKKIAEFVEETLRDYFRSDNPESDYSGFDAFLFESLDAISKGVSIGEIIFASGRDRVYIENVKFKPQHLFAFGETALAQHSTATLAYPQTGSLKLRQGIHISQMIGAELPEEKFFVFSYRPRYGVRWGQALLKYVFWASWMKRASVRQWLKYQEKGTGVVVARYPGAASEKDKANAIEAAASIVEENAVAIPDKFLLEVHEMVRALGDTHEKFVEAYCNTEITLRLLGQSLTSRGSDGGGGSRALGEIHEKVRGEYTEMDCKQVAIPVNKRLVKPITQWNFGPNAKLPTFKLDYEPIESIEGKSARFVIARKDLNLPISKKQVYGELELDTPENEEDTLGGEVKQETENDALDAETVSEFAEKKTLKSPSLTNNYANNSNSKTVRFRRLRPSMIEFSDE